MCRAEGREAGVLITHTFPAPPTHPHLTHCPPAPPPHTHIPESMFQTHISPSSLEVTRVGEPSTSTMDSTSDLWPLMWRPGPTVLLLPSS